MKSHPCVKTGAGVPPASEPISQLLAIQPVNPQPLTTSPRVKNLTPCRHINRRGHHCRLFSVSPNEHLCPHHARQLHDRKQLRNDKNAAELLGDLEDFTTPENINFFLGNLVRQLARKRIHRRDAMALAYLGQLLLGSISAIDRHAAAIDATGNGDVFPTRIVFDRPDDLDERQPDLASRGDESSQRQPGDHDRNSEQSR